MALTDKREEAERLYVRQGMPCPAIAEQLEVNAGTVYRWKEDAAAKGEALDWDTQRRIYTMSPKELLAIYAESVKAWILELKKNPKLLADPKVADAICKHISAMQKIDPRSQYLGVAIDLIKTANAWLAEHEPELKTRMEPFWERIFEALNKELTAKDIL